MSPSNAAPANSSSSSAPAAAAKPLSLTSPAELARQLHIVPLVSIADQMVVAASQPVDGDQWMAILEATGMDVRFVLAEPNVIEAALDVYYPRAA